MYWNKSQWIIRQNGNIFFAWLYVEEAFLTRSNRWREEQVVSTVKAQNNLSFSKSLTSLSYISVVFIKIMFIIERI